MKPDEKDKVMNLLKELSNSIDKYTIRFKTDDYNWLSKYEYDDEL